MSVTYIPAEMRRTVRQRAGNRCEYCGIREEDTEFGCEVDHILSEKHLGSIRSTDDPVFVRFFNPRTDVWSDHFEYGALRRILPKTDIGQVTARIFGFNAENRLLERQALQEE